MSTKIHAAGDASGRPVRLIAGPGQENDMARAHELIDGLVATATIGDKSYDADPLEAKIIGQGSQVVGMGKALADTFAAARDVFGAVDEALGEKLTAVMWEGPADRLTLTENAQPALMAVSLAAMRVLDREAGLDLKRDAAFVAGHSLGE